MASSPVHRRRSLRFWLPLTVFLIALVADAIMYLVGARIHRREFEQEFTAAQKLRATRIQAEVERWVQRDDPDMVETLFAELGVFPEISAAAFLDADDLVLASTRRATLGRPLAVERLGSAGIEAAQFFAAMQKARRTEQTTTWLTNDQNGLLVCLPTALPLQPGSLELRRGALILIVYDLRLEKAARVRRFQQDFVGYLANTLVLALALGVSLHFLITRRLESLETAMTDFAGGKAVTLTPPRFNDEISRLVRRFNEMAGTIMKTMEEVQDLYDHAPCGYHSLDGSGTFIRINETELSWLGYTREEIVGRLKFSDLLTPASLQAFLHNFPKFKVSGVVKDIDFDLIRKDGTILPVVLSATAIVDAEGRFVKSRSMMYDITELKRAREQINALNADLEHRVELRTRQLEEATRELVAFSYSISHDLRTPLRSINGFSYTLLKDYADKLDAAGIEDLHRVRAASQKMGQLIDEMVRLLRISRIELRWTDVDLSRMAERLAGELKAAEPDRHVEFSIAPGCIAQGDPSLLRVVVENALGNAWKYTRSRSQAKIEFTRTDSDHETIYRVRDNGCGFDMQYAQKLFSAFQRLQPERESTGTGMGLACLRRAVQRHGGRTWIEGAVDQGATLYFTLPKATIAPRSAASPLPAG